MPRALRILVGWELGNGLGHVGRLRPVIERLSADGHSVRVAARYPDAAASLRSIERVDVVQAPFWTFERASPTPASPTRAATLADILVRGGFADDGTVFTRALEWRTLLDRTRPDLVVTDYAPALNAIARGSAPVVALGSGFSVPPPDGLYPLAPRRTALPVDASRAADRIVRAFGAAATKIGFPPPASFGRLFTGTSGLATSSGSPEANALPLIHPLLDPYRRWRKQPTLPPIGIPLPHPTSAEREGVFVYLPEDHPQLHRLLSVLARIRVGGAIHARPQDAELSLDTATWIARSGLVRLPRLAELSSMLPAVKVVIHSGGLNVAHAALYARTPQLLLPTNLEQRMTAETLHRTGKALHVPPHGAAAGSIERALMELLERPTHRAEPIRRDPGMHTIETIMHRIGQLCETQHGDARSR